MAGSLLSKMELRELCERAEALHIDGLEIVTGDPVASQISSLHAGCSDIVPESGPSGGCAAAFSGLTILPDGTITPCRRLPVPIGNVRRDSLREVWATSEVLQRLRDQGSYRGKCGTCSRWNVCRGCRAIAYAYAHLQGQADYLAEDPQCFIES
jgi:radical SAM protein with 4Fe4S-binding SPASM domain